MKNRKKIIIKFLIVIVSFICADGGSSFILAENSIQVIMNHAHENEGEAPHQHNLFNLCDDEKWIDTSGINFINQDNRQFTSLYKSENPSDKFQGSVWQPPKSV